MHEHIKLPNHLAEIENPHPVLLVGENHKFAGQGLMVMRSLPHLKKKNYSHLFFEHTEEEKSAIRVLKTDLLKDRGLRADYLDNPDYIKCMITMSIETQAEAEKISTVFADWSGKYDATSKKLMKEYETVDKNWVNQNIQALFDKMIQKLCTPSIFSFFKKNKQISDDDVSRGIIYAGYGPKSFDNFQKTCSLSSSAKEKIYMAGTHLSKLLDYRIGKSKAAYQLVTRNQYTAQSIADIHRQNPKTKKISYNGYSHIDDGTSAHEQSNYSVLSEILENEHDIKATNVILVEKNNIRKIKENFAFYKIDPSLICPEEFLRQVDVRFELNAAEAYYALAKEEPEEGLHDLRDLGVGRIDYAIVMPPIEQQTALLNACTKAAYILKK